MTTWILALIIFAIAATMTMTGRGGGNFYVLAIALSGTGMHVAATTGQITMIPYCRNVPVASRPCLVKEICWIKTSQDRYYCTTDYAFFNIFVYFVVHFLYLYE